MSAAQAHEGKLWLQPLPYTFGRSWPELNDGVLYTDVVGPTKADVTLIDFYSSNHHSSAPIQGWIQRIRNGQIIIDGEAVTDPDTIVRCGSTLIYSRVPWEEPFAPYQLEVLYEDDDIVAINKPSGLQVLPGGLFQQRTVLQQLKWNVWSEPGSCCSNIQHPVPVHRLGRGTSGILLCAKTKAGKVCLASRFAEGTANGRSYGAQPISKIYRALVTGILQNDEVLVQQPIGLINYPGVAHGLHVASSSGKPATSMVHVLERSAEQNQTLVQVEIHSGRPHQIRIHLASIGHPLLGDPLYVSGGKPSTNSPGSSTDTFDNDGGYVKPAHAVPGDCGYHLHAFQLTFHHPTMEQVVKIEAPLPLILRTRAEQALYSSV